MILMTILLTMGIKDPSRRQRPQIVGDAARPAHSFSLYIRLMQNKYKDNHSGDDDSDMMVLRSRITIMMTKRVLSYTDDDHD